MGKTFEFELVNQTFTGEGTVFQIALCGLRSLLHPVGTAIVNAVLCFFSSEAFVLQLVDQAAGKIVETARRTGARVSGPVPLPTEKEVVTILRAVHKYKDAREQFETRTHKRLIDILRPSNKTVEALQGLELPAGVDIEIKL